MRLTLALITVASGGGGRPQMGPITHVTGRLSAMTKLLSFVGATVGGYAGWALGALIGPFSAFMVSMIGTGVGMYYGRRIARNIGT